MIVQTWRLLHQGGALARAHVHRAAAGAEALHYAQLQARWGHADAAGRLLRGDHHGVWSLAVLFERAALPPARRALPAAPESGPGAWGVAAPAALYLGQDVLRRR